MRREKRKKEQGRGDKIVFLVFLSALVVQNQYAQTNQELYTQFIQQLAKQEGNHFLSYNGYAKEIDSLFFKTDSLAQNRLIPQKWEINYLPLSEKHYLRQLSLQMRIQKKDTFTFFEAKYQDTLTKRQVKDLIRTENIDFQGKNPFWQDLYLKPAATIVSGVVLIFGFFYVRSQ